MRLRWAVAGGGAGRDLLVRGESVEGADSHLVHRGKVVLTCKERCGRLCMVWPGNERTAHPGPGGYDHGTAIEAASTRGQEERLLLAMGKRIVGRKLGCEVVLVQWKRVRNVMMWQPELVEQTVPRNRARARIPCRRMSQKLDAVAVEAVADVTDGGVGGAVVGAAEAAAAGICTVG